MINIGIKYKEKIIQFEGYEPIPFTMLQHPSVVLHLIDRILKVTHYSGETICLEFWDEAGIHHEVNRWGSMRRL